MKRIRLDRGEAVRLDTDISDLDSAAEFSAREKQMTRLQPEERHRRIGPDRRALRPSARALDATRKVHRQYLHAGRIRRLDQPQRIRLQRQAHARAVERIDQQVRTAQSLRPRQRHHPFEPARCLCRITPQRAALPMQQHGHPIPLLTEEARSDKAIATIVARAGEHQDLGSHRQCNRGPCDRRTGPLHQLDARHACGYRRGVGFAHLGWGKQLDHLNLIAAPALTPRS